MCSWNQLVVTPWTRVCLKWRSTRAGCRPVLPLLRNQAATVSKDKPAEDVAWPGWARRHGAGQGGAWQSRAGQSGAGRRAGGAHAAPCRPCRPCHGTGPRGQDARAGGHFRGFGSLSVGLSDPAALPSRKSVSSGLERGPKIRLGEGFLVVFKSDPLRLLPRGWVGGGHLL